MIWISILALGLSVGCRDRAARAAEVRQRDLEALPVAVGGVMEQLGAEATARERSSETISLEAVIARSGEAFGAPQQVLGRTTLARYCASAESAAGFRVTVCEYPSVEQAGRGASEAKLVRGSSSGWQGQTRKKSVLEVVSRSNAEPQRVARVVAAFREL